MATKYSVVEINSSGFFNKFEKLIQQFQESQTMEMVGQDAVETAREYIHDYEPGGQSREFWSYGKTGTGGTSNAPWEAYRDSMGKPQPEPGALSNSISFRVLSKGYENVIGIFDVAKMNVEAPYWKAQEDGFEFVIPQTGATVTIQPKNYLKNATEVLFLQLAPNTIREGLRRAFSQNNVNG